MFALKSVYLAFLAVVCQAAGVFLIDPSDLADPLRRALIMAGYPLAIAFIWRNRANVGLLVLGLGLVLNFLAMAANGGLMPVTSEHVAQSGLSEKIAGVQPGHAIPGTKNILVTQGETRLGFLSDVLVLPHASPHQRVVSLGDVLVAFGLVALVASPGVRYTKTRIGLRRVAARGPETLALQGGTKRAKRTAGTRYGSEP